MIIFWNSFFWFALFKFDANPSIRLIKTSGLRTPEIWAIKSDFSSLRTELCSISCLNSLVISSTNTDSNDAHIGLLFGICIPFWTIVLNSSKWITSFLSSRKSKSLITWLLGFAIWKRIPWPPLQSISHCKFSVNSKADLSFFWLRAFNKLLIVCCNWGLFVRLLTTFWELCTWFLEFFAITIRSI